MVSTHEILRRLHHERARFIGIGEPRRCKVLQRCQCRGRIESVGAKSFFDLAGPAITHRVQGIRCWDAVGDATVRKSCAWICWLRCGILRAHNAPMALRMCTLPMMFLGKELNTEKKPLPRQLEQGSGGSNISGLPAYRVWSQGLPLPHARF